jgi:hypothetical protein
MYGLAGTTTDADRCLKLNNNTGAVDDLNSIYTVNKEGCESIGGIWTTTAYEATHANVKNSTIKDTLESWYQTYIEDAGYSDYVSDELFCNDREVQTDLNANGGYPASIGVSTLGYGAYLDIYMSFYRVGYKVDNPKPQFKCTQKNDAFTVSDSKKGNASLSKPIGLITLDEVSAAGGKYYSDTNIYSNYNYYLYKGYAYWSMVPLSNEKNKTIYNTMGFITNTGGFFAVSNTSQIGLAPVINLSFKTANSLIGTGIIGDEYRLPSE